MLSFFFRGLFGGYFLILFSQTALSQSIFSTAFNTTGGSKKIELGQFSNYLFEWSIGEASIVTTNTAPNYQVTHGLLQGFLLTDPLIPYENWSIEELKIHPNPVKSSFVVEILSNYTGEVALQLFAASGQLVQARKFNYYGAGSSQQLLVSNLASGIYFLRADLKLFPENGGYIIKQKTFKIIKVN
jgi:hypothetical protein